MELLGFFLTLFLIGLGGIALFILGVAVLIKLARWLIGWIIGDDKTER